MFGVLLSGGVAHAQNGGEITGTVTDPTGAVVPNVDVKITSVETGNSRSTKSNGAGIFDFRIGQWRLQPDRRLHRLRGLQERRDRPEHRPNAPGRYHVDGRLFDPNGGRTIKRSSGSVRDQ